MSTRVTFDGRLGEIDPVPDQPFRVAVGCYTGVVVTALGVSVLGVTGYAHPAVVLFTSMTLFVAGIVLGAVAVRRWSHGPERLGGSPRRFLFVVPGIGLLLLGMLSIQLGWGILMTNVYSGVLTAIVGAGLALMAKNRHVAVWLGDADPLVTWEASWPRSVRIRWAVVTNGAVGSLLAIVVGVWFVSDVTFEFFSVLNVFQLLFVANMPLFGTKDRGFSVYDEGLVPDSAVSKRLYHWEDFGGYRLTETELRIERSWRPDLRFERGDIEDVDAVVAALDSHLRN